MNRTALITGASGGIGFELSQIFARDRINLILVARSKEKLEGMAFSLSRDYGINVTPFPADLSDMEQVKKVYEHCRQNSIQVDYLVNNAGFGDNGYFVESDWNRQLEMINLNITALTYLTRLFLPEMVSRQSGKILNVASTAAFQPGPMMSVYYASKAYVLSFSEAISNELEGKGVTVTALCPGATVSGFQKAAALEESKLFKGKKLPSSAEVAAFGYRAMNKGKVVAIHGFMNAVLATSIRFTPRFLVRRVVRGLHSEAK
jgi:uncharacterized protein